VSSRTPRTPPRPTRSSHPRLHGLLTPASLSATFAFVASFPDPPPRPCSRLIVRSDLFFFLFENETTPLRAHEGRSLGFTRYESRLNVYTQVHIYEES